MVQLRFDRDAKFAVAAAFDRAGEFRHPYLGTEHLLLGLAGTVPELFPLEPKLDELKRQVTVHAGPQPRSQRVKPYTDQAQHALRTAEEYALGRGSTVVTAKDLLRGLRATAGGVAATLLAQLGLQPVREGPAPSTTREARTADDFIRLTDSSSAPYYEQIEACIKEAVAAGQLIPGDRLPPVRQLADLLEIAPGTVARAYRQLESAGVVITAGAHGTIVASAEAKDVTEVDVRINELARLLRPVAVTAFHMGATIDDLSAAMGIAVQGVFEEK